MTDHKFDIKSASDREFNAYLELKNRVAMAAYIGMVERAAFEPERERSSFGLVQMYAQAMEAGEVYAVNELRRAERLTHERRQALKEQREARAVPWDLNDKRNFQLQVLVADPVNNGIDPSDINSDFIRGFSAYMPHCRNQPSVATVMDGLVLVSSKPWTMDETTRIHDLISALSVGERQLVLDWAVSVMHDASDNVDVLIPQRPHCLQAFDHLLPNLGVAGPTLIPKAESNEH